MEIGKRMDNQIYDSLAGTIFSPMLNLRGFIIDDFIWYKVDSVVWDGVLASMDNIENMVIKNYINNT